MSMISKDGLEQVNVIKAALDSMYDKLNKPVFIKSGKDYKPTDLYNSVKDEFEAIAGIVQQANDWTEV